MNSVFSFSTLRTGILLFLVSVLLVPIATSSVVARTRDCAPNGPTDPMELLPVSLTLSGWGWRIVAGCVTCMDYGNAVLELDGSAIPRDNVTGVSDLYLTGTLSLSATDWTDNFTLELRGTRVRSTFFLKQVVGGSNPLIAEFEGVWFDYEEPAYVACEGRVGVPAAGHVADVYLFALRNGSAGTIGIPGNSWLGKITIILDSMADSIAAAGSQIQSAIGDGMARLTQVLLFWTT